MVRLENKVGGGYSSIDENAPHSVTPITTWVLPDGGTPQWKDGQGYPVSVGSGDGGSRRIPNCKEKTTGYRIEQGGAVYNVKDVDGLVKPAKGGK